MSTRLRAIQIAATDIDAAGTFLGAVCGATPLRVDGEVLVPIDDAALVIKPPRSRTALGICGLEIEVGQDETESHSLHGLDIRLLSAEPQVAAKDPADVILDHLAVVVRDLERSTEQWETTVGVSAELIGIHPASNGAFRAARLLIGDRMLELVTPVAGVESALAARLDRSDEGPVVLAMPAKDLETKLDQLNGMGITVFHQDPHWFVHPANPASVLIQLTPRVDH